MPRIALKTPPIKATRTMLSIQATPVTAEIRTATLFEQEHTVIPCVALVEGVLWPANAPSPELALAEEFGKFPEGWNGRPVVYNHPSINGAPVSASSPDVLEDNAFGQLFNTQLDGGKLKTEIWINNARIGELGEEAQEVIEALKVGDETIEVSTGLFTMSEESAGEFDGQEYSTIWRNIVPDHLAVLPRGVKGACSVADGCGAPRTNQMKPVMRACQMTTFNKSPDCACEGEDEEKKGLFKRLMDNMGDLIGFTNNAEGLSDGDLRTALMLGLTEAIPDEVTWILAVYQGIGNSGTFIYESGWQGQLYQRNYTVDANAVSIGSEATSVRPVTEFVPVEVTVNNTPDSPTQEKAMNKEKLVNELVANAATQYTEDDREWLSTLEATQLEKMSPVISDEGEGEGEEGNKTKVEVEVEGEKTAPTANCQNAAPAAPITTDSYIAAAPPEVQAILESGLRMHRARKATLVEALTNNARCRFSADQLNARPVEELENMAALAHDISFEGQAAVLTDNSAQEEDAGYTPAPTIFKTQAEAEA